MAIIRFYKRCSVDLQRIIDDPVFLSNIDKYAAELCFHVEIERPVSAQEESVLVWLFKDPQQSENSISKTSSLIVKDQNLEAILEIGPRLNFSTPSSTNSVSILQNVNIPQVTRIERSTRYYFQFKPKINASEEVDGLEFWDKMTQCRYYEDLLPKISFNENMIKSKSDWFTIPIVEKGRSALEEINQSMGLAFDEWDLEYYTTLFKDKLKRNPTNVEIFDCAQSNSEHSRHWFFKGKMIVDGKAQKNSLIDMIIATQDHSNANNTIKFSDNSSAILGYRQNNLQPSIVGEACKMEKREEDMDLIFTAETHNMPTAVEPFSGATTGTGGRLRDVQAVGRGGLPIAGTAGYCVGVLNIPNYDLPYEEKGLNYPLSFADPLKVLIRASDGASDYGNKFGEPLICGFVTSYGWVNPENNHEREEYVKPIMFSGGVGLMPAILRQKLDPKEGFLLAKLGGPVYRIGVGGGAASSVVVQGTNEAALDFNAVQRGDAEMENKLNRVIRSCVELGKNNPIVAIHDQGAGGNGNVLKELVEKNGARIFTKDFKLGDPTLSTLELWGAEYQESNAILCRAEDRNILEKICQRERCPVDFVGRVKNDGFVKLIEGSMSDEAIDDYEDHPFNMHLDDILGKMPQKVYNLDRCTRKVNKFSVPDIKNIDEIVKTLFSIVSVGSKRFLTNKVDRSVTGLIAQQQCVGPLQVPLSDFAICSSGYFGSQGIATSVGSQPLKGIICPKAGARMSVAEAISNLVFVKVSSLADVKCSGNWMWPAKLPGEGARLYEACEEMCLIMKELNIAVDGGKDSLSMATRVGEDVVKSPDTLVISTYVQCPDVNVKITPDLKMPLQGGRGELIWVNIEGIFRLGGSAFSQSLGQQGNDCPTLMKTETLKNAFNITQDLLARSKLLAGHDISEGGLITCLLEMAFGGCCGLNIDIPYLNFSAAEVLFSEETGWILETKPENMTECLAAFNTFSVPVYYIGQSYGKGLSASISIKYNDQLILKNSTRNLMKQWEMTSFEIEKIQMNTDCAKQEFRSYDTRETGPTYHCTFDPDMIHPEMTRSPIRVAVVREEGVNGDREMIATLMNANFEVHDVAMWDLLNGKTSLDNYRGVVFPGGFSYADTLGSGKGWAASIKFNESLLKQFDHFKQRNDTFSIGVCNGCQLMGFLGWIGEGKDVSVPNVALVNNKSGRYESRWSSVKVLENTNSVFLKRMVGSVMGCWIAHGEGQFSFKTDRVLEDLKKNNCVAMAYVDDNCRPTEEYPLNPNGSQEGIAAISSKDGRHLALMPHPERCSIMWQWPYIPHGFQFKKSPWQTLFDEAQIWCSHN